MIIRSRASVSIMLVLLIGLAASCGGDGIGNVLPGGSTLPGDGSVESPSPSEPSDTQPPDSQPPDSQPPDTQPPDSQPPDTQPPDTQPPDSAPEGDEPDDGSTSSWPSIVAILIGVAALIAVGSALRKRRPPTPPAATDRRLQLISMARWIHDQLSLEVLGLPSADAQQRWNAERNRLDQLAIDLRVQASERDSEVWNHLATTISALSSSLDTAVRLRSTPDVDDQLAREAVTIANRHRADLTTALQIAEQTI